MSRKHETEILFDKLRDAMAELKKIEPHIFQEEIDLFIEHFHLITQWHQQLEDLHSSMLPKAKHLNQNKKETEYLLRRSLFQVIEGRKSN